MLVRGFLWVAYVHKILAKIKKNGRGRNFSVGEKYDL